MQIQYWNDDLEYPYIEYLEHYSTHNGGTINFGDIIIKRHFSSINNNDFFFKKRNSLTHAF